MASGAARETTNTGSAAGWSARSTNGSRAMIFGAASNSSALHQAPPPATAKAGTRPRSPLDSDTASTTPAAPICGDERHREAEMEARAVAHMGVAGGEVGMHRERRLHIGEGRDDDAPDALGGVERQDAVVALDQPAHHVGLARGPERRAGLLRLLHRDQPVDDVAALHQQPVHGLVDAVDLAAQVGERRGVGIGLFGHGYVSWHGGQAIGVRAAIDRGRSGRNQRKH